MSEDALIKDAVARVWCSPEQDYQAIYKIHRLTGYNGAKKYWSSLMIDINLPDQENYYHLFNFGQLVPELIALFPFSSDFPVEFVWTTVEESANLNNTVVDVYFDNGVKIPLHSCWFTVTDERALILAIKDDKKIGKILITDSTSSVNMGNDSVYVRIYKNHYFSSQECKPGDSVYYRSACPKNNAEFSAFQNAYDQAKTKPGYTLAYRNGYLVNKISLTTCQVGDVMEFVYDDSVKDVVDFPLSGLPTFLSTLYSNEKYLLHRNKLSDKSKDEIDFHDDIDLFLWSDDRVFLQNGQLDTSKAYKQPGIYVHKNTPKALTQITHRDHACPVSMISSFLEKNKNTVLPLSLDKGIDQIYLRVVVRQSGHDRQLVDDYNRIKELYKLPDPAIVTAMVGVNALVPTWVASNLEASDYCSLMSWPMNKALTKQKVSNAYGYDSVANLIGKSPVKTEIESSQLICVLPQAFVQDCTGFEFDEQGFYLGHQYHDDGIAYRCLFNNTKYVEFIRGKLHSAAHEFYNQSGIVIDPLFDWGFYIKPASSNPQTTAWECVNGDSSKYIIDNVSKKITWLCSKTHHVLARSNKNAVLIEKTFDLIDGMMGFNIEIDNLVNGQVVTKATQIPFGEMDLWINGRYGICGLDYKVDWPHVCVINRQYLVDQQQQKVTVVLKGLCTVNKEFTDETEYGFVVNGRLSVNKQYNLRSDKASRYFLGGGVKMLDEITFVEDDANFEMLHAYNGKPYVIKENVVNLKEYTDSSSYTLMALSKEVDKRVGDYLTQRSFGIETPSTINPIANRHRLYSPFISAIVSDLKRGYLNPDFIYQKLNEEKVSSSLKEYIFLLDYDPICDENLTRNDCVIIDAHCWGSVIELTIHQYLYVKMIISIYAKSVIGISSHFRVKI